MSLKDDLDGIEMRLAGSADSVEVAKVVTAVLNSDAPRGAGLHRHDSGRPAGAAEAHSDHLHLCDGGDRRDFSARGWHRHHEHRAGDGDGADPRDRHPPVGGCAAIRHRAAVFGRVGINFRRRRPSHEVNIDGTFNVLRAAREGGVGRVVYAASSSAYGDTEVLPKVETMAPRPKSPYALQKLTGEGYCTVFSQVFGLETVALRYFNVYGPRQDPSSPYSGVLSLFMRSAIEGRAPTIFGDGEQSRDFTYVEDVAELNLKAARARNVSGMVINGGNGGRITLNQAWALVQRLAGVDIAARYAAPRAGDVRDSQADTTLAERSLGHAPRFSFEEGMRRTLDWYRSAQ